MNNKELEQFIDLCQKYCIFKIEGLDTDFIVEGKDLSIESFKKLGYGKIEVNMGFCPSL